MPEFNPHPTTSGLFIPKDVQGEARARIVATLKLTTQLLSEAAIGELSSPQLTQALAPEVFRLIYHEGLVE